MTNTPQYQKDLPTTYIPQYQKKLLNLSSSNFSLAFPRLSEWGWRGDKPVKGTNAIENLCGIGNESLQATQELLRSIHTRQKLVLSSPLVQKGFALELTARLESPYVSGLGAGHPTETGFILDRNTGLPFIPSSSIKGVLRLACALVLADRGKIIKQEIKGKTTWDVDGRGEDSYLKRFFGNETEDKEHISQGQLVFLDAFPAEFPTLKTDIMNPHYNTYYRGEKGPVETDSPVPVKFLALPEGTSFVFRIYANGYYTTSSEQEDMDTLLETLKKAFSFVGFGAKTSIGYGRFKWPEKQQKEGTYIRFYDDKEPVKTLTASTNRQPSQVTGQYKPLKPPTKTITDNSTQICELMEEKTKKGGWKAVCVADKTYFGAISNSSDIPNTAKPGDKIEAIIVSAKPENCNIKYKNIIQ